MSGFALLAAEAAAEAGNALSVERFEEIIRSAPVMSALMVLLKYGAGLAGLVLLVRLYQRWNRTKAGLADPVESPGGRAIRPFSLMTASGIAFGAYLLAFVLTIAAASVTQALAPRLTMMALGMFPAALATIWMRQKMREGAVTPPKKALVGGLHTFAIASAVSIPLSMLSLVLMHAVGESPRIQDALEMAIDPGDPSNLWVVAAYGIVLAPLLEESLFRGLLYPAIRDAVGGRGGIWLSALMTSALFAAVHSNTFAALPLFGLAVVLTLVFERTNSLATVVFGHAFFNAASMVPLLVGRLEGAL